MPGLSTHSKLLPFRDKSFEFMEVVEPNDVLEEQKKSWLCIILYASNWLNLTKFSATILFQFKWAIEKILLYLSFLGPGFNSRLLERINRNERNMIRKKKESTKEFWKLALVILDQVFIRQSFAIILPIAPTCARHRLVLNGIFRVSSHDRCHFFIN